MIITLLPCDLVSWFHACIYQKQCNSCWTSLRAQVRNPPPLNLKTSSESRFETHPSHTLPGMWYCTPLEVRTDLGRHGNCVCNLCASPVSSWCLYFPEWHKRTKIPLRGSWGFLCHPVLCCHSCTGATPPFSSPHTCLFPSPLPDLPSTTFWTCPS